MQEFDENLEECGIEELYGERATVLSQTEPLYVGKVRKVKDRLEELYRTHPEEFYRRKRLIQDAIKDREKGYQRAMLQFTVEELRDVLKFSEGLYR